MLSHTTLKLIQVVRHFGPVGGMERYVWEVTRELSKLGYEVIVLCEQCHAPPPAGVTVHELGRLRSRPRWLAYLRFGRRVENWLACHQPMDCIIHSHERIGVHDVTTFHGPPFASVRDKPWWKKLSLRVAMQCWLERRELRVARAIIPNSPIIARQLADYYPEYAHKLTAPIVPGVVPGVTRPPRKVAQDGGIVGFVGREWQRKGLSRAVAIVAQLRNTRPRLEFWVIGPEPRAIEYLFKDWHGAYRLLGWRTDNAHFEQIDVLLHPARAEPYGMVISEAMAACVPVVVSELCGAAAQVSQAHGMVMRLDAPLREWVKAVEEQLGRNEPAPGFVRGWNVVARECAAVYEGIG